MKTLLIISPLVLLLGGCTPHDWASLGLQAAYPSNDPISAEYQYKQAVQRQIDESEREYYRNRRDSDAPIFVTPERY